MPTGKANKLRKNCRSGFIPRDRHGLLGVYRGINPLLQPISNLINPKIPIENPLKAQIKFRQSVIGLLPFKNFFLGSRAARPLLEGPA